MTPLAQLARKVFAVGLEAVHPRAVMRRVRFTGSGVRFDDDAMEPAGRFVLVAVGKAGGQMAGAFLARSLRRPDQVWVLVPRGVPVPPAVVPHTRLGTHPQVTEENASHARELADLLRRLERDDGVVVLLSGGSSALLSEPLPGISVHQLAELTAALLRAGATIAQLNTVRKHLCRPLGGRLAALCPAPLLALVLSDVPGDDLATVASGPTVPDPTTSEDALAVLSRFGLATRFPWAVAALEKPDSETPKPDDPRFRNKTTRLLGSNRDALAAMAAALAAEGLTPHLVTHRLRGEAREVGRTLGALLVNAPPGTAFLAGGETTVQVTGSGTGGRNLELALAAARELAGHSHRCLLAAGSDGVDGTSPAAGAVVDGGTVRRARRQGKDPEQALAENDSWGFFSGLPEAIVTGPTGTNVADLVIALAAPQARRGFGVRASARVQAFEPPLHLKGTSSEP